MQVAMCNGKAQCAIDRIIWSHQQQFIPTIYYTYYSIWFLIVEESPAKRRSEEPLVKLNVTSEEDNKNKNLDKDFEKEKGEDTENDGIKKNKKENENNDTESDKVEKEEKEEKANMDDEKDEEDGEEDEIYEVEKIIDYAYCKESVK